MTEQETLYTITLSLTPHLKTKTQRQLLEAFGSATAVYENRLNPAAVLPKASRTAKEALATLDKQLKRAEQELAFINRYHIRALSIRDDAYPARLKDCPDAPIILFCKGNADLNTPYVISMVGTRKATPYGKKLCQDFVAELKDLCPHVLIVSGLAYGIDIHSHRAALNNQIPTVAILAHGLDTIYPASHRDDALRMMENGALLTEFVSRTNADKKNFIVRNRIIAGMADAIVVVESGEKGGALITAQFASDYNRDVFVFPGRTSDQYSIGCNRLASQNKAAIILSARDLIDDMGWQRRLKTMNADETMQRELFPELNPEEQQIVNLLKTSGAMPINSLAEKLGKPVHLIASLLVNLEIKGVTESIPGGKHKLL